MPRICFVAALIALAAAVPATGSSAPAVRRFECRPTRPDMLGPFYKPGAPFRRSVGQGYTLTGTVLSARDCRPIKGALVELWLVGPDGRYDDEHRASLHSDESGRYSFQSNMPPGYAGRPSHIHIMVTAPGFRPLITQHYPAGGLAEATFDLVLTPESAVLPGRSTAQAPAPFLPCALKPAPHADDIYIDDYLNV